MLNAFGFRNALNCLGLLGLQVDRQIHTFFLLKNRSWYFFQLVLEISQVMCVPEARQFFD